MRVERVRHECGDGTCVLAADVRSEAWSREEFTLWYRVPSGVVADHGGDAPDASPFVAGLLLWALRRGEPLLVDGVASSRLLESIPRLVDVYRAFWPDLLSDVEVKAEPRAATPGSGVVASFFTRGVDSWYTARTHGERPYDGSPLTHLVYVPSVDFMFDDAHLHRCIQATTAAARRAGFTPLIAETNLRRHTERFLHWGHYHGAGLASVALALGARTVLLPAARSYAYLEPEGTHPLLDPLWSTERTEVVHHGAEATRWEKVERLAKEDVPLETLKVCFDENTDGNCGECPKCLVTMTLLAAAGVLERCPFDAPFSRRQLAGLDLPDSMVEMLRTQVLPAVHDTRLALALHHLVVRHTMRRARRDVTAAGRAAARGLASYRRERNNRAGS